MPCFLPAGLKCPPALVKGGSHLPTACTWKACSPAGNPLTASAISTPDGVCVSVAIPASLPSAVLSAAFALCAEAGRAVAAINSAARPAPLTNLDMVMRSEEHTSELQSPVHLVC